MSDEEPIEEVSLRDLEQAKQKLLKTTIKDIGKLKPGERLRVLEFLDDALTERKVKNVAAGVQSGGVVYDRKKALEMLQGRGRVLMDEKS